MIKENKCCDALAVMVFDYSIAKFLSKNDPKALEQAVASLFDLSGHIYTFEGEGEKKHSPLELMAALENVSVADIEILSCVNNRIFLFAAKEYRIVKMCYVDSGKLWRMKYSSRRDMANV